MPRTKEQIEQIKKQKQQLIMQAALELFAKKGFHATSVEEIARRAGVSKGLIYNYFKSKKDILIAIVNSLFVQMDQAFLQLDTKMLTAKDLESYIRVSMQAVEIDPQILRMYFMLYMQPDIEDIVKPMVKSYLDKIIEMLGPYYQKKGIDNPRPIILALISALDGLSLHYILLQYPEFDDILDFIIKKFVYL